MTTSSSTASSGGQRDFDTGPLSWVMAEIRETLARTRNTVQEAVSQQADARKAALHQAKTSLHQAHGALQVVDVDGVGIVTETVEDLLDRLEAEQLELTAEVAQVIATACDAVIEYLEELLAGEPHQPVRLFPYYRSLLESRGDGRVHPADLFFPDLSIRPALPEAQPVPANFKELRQHYEQLLLPFLRSADPATENAYAAAMAAIIKQVEEAQSVQQIRAFWRVIRAFAEGVASGRIGHEVYAKQVFARINLQIRRLANGAAAPAERLLRDGLFFIAQSRNPSRDMLKIRKAYQLEGAVPANYDEKRYGHIDSEILALAKDRVARAKSLWGRIAAGDAASVPAFEQQMQALAEAGTKLNSEPFSNLLRKLTGIARHSARAGAGDSLGLEVAASLLFVENVLQHPHRLNEGFAEEAEALTGRLLALASGDPTASDGAWVDGISRAAMEEQTMAVLVAQMQSSLEQVEKVLDEYFANPANKEPLKPVDAMLHQLEGAMVVLDQPHALRAIEHVRGMVQRFVQSDPESSPSSEKFQQLAQNIGALSFFIERLRQHPASARKQFSFNDELGVFQANVNEKKNSNREPIADPILLDEAALPADTPPSLEAEIGGIDDAHAAPLVEEISIPEVKEPISDEAFSSPSADVVDSVPAVSSAPAVSPSVAAFEEEQDAIDAELLGIFLEEAREVLDWAAQITDALKEDAANQEHMTTVRRCFHTLKGSSRMVALDRFSSAAWAVEQVLNVHLADAQPGTPALYALLDKAVELMNGWIADLHQQNGAPCNPEALIEAADRVKQGQPFHYGESESKAVQASDSENGAAPVSEEGDAAAFAETFVEDSLSADRLLFPAEAGIVQDTDDEIVLASAEGDAFPEIELQQDEERRTEGDEILGLDVSNNPDSPASLSESNVIDFPPLTTGEATHDDTVKRIGDLQISVPLYNIYMAETDELVRALVQDFAEWRHEAERPVSALAVQSAHSLAGSSATVGFDPLQELAHALEMVLQTLMRNPVQLQSHEFDLLDASVGRVKDMLQQFALCEMPAAQPEQVRLLKELKQEVFNRADREGPQPPQTSFGDEVRDEESSPAGLQALTPFASDTAALAETENQLFDRVPVDEAAATPLPKDEIDADLLPVFVEEAHDMLPQMQQALREWQTAPNDFQPAHAMLRMLHTLKGSARMAGAMALGQHLHDMESRIQHLMGRGSAHADEVGELLAHLDAGLQMFERIQHRQTDSSVAEPAVPPSSSTVEGKAALPDEEVAPAASNLLAPSSRQVAEPVSADAPPVPAQPITVPLVRVRSDLLDRLLNQAGEVSISRSKIETEVSSLRQSLNDLTDNMARLRGHLREMEIQAETQMASQMAQSADRDFDPLEFDRFTRLQELTRIMAENVNDVTSLQQNLARGVDGTLGDLGAQARLTRELQQDLMRVRMVQFATISERLYRVTRQAAKETGKRVNLDIRGGSVELDRSVLEKMVGPFEHLLRNSIVHGIESREARLAAGKSETGEIQIEILQDGNEIVISVADDGQGLNLTRIRDKAQTVGLLSSDDEVSDSEVQEFIFHPGFSTAQEVTELAGRGVGLDVVRAEAAAVGGRIAVYSDTGRGTQFVVRLPMSMAVTQVVLVVTGGKTYAVPTALVEQVQQLRANALAAVYNEGTVSWRGSRVPVHYLPALLGDMQATPRAQEYSPIVILRSGDERAAIHVDQVIGNREVVVKNVGPQLARLLGVVGATVTGPGDIVLILDPVPLAYRSKEIQRAPRLTAAKETDSDSVGAVAEMVAAGPAQGSAEPVQGLRTQPIVMVVDDSLTVRRVTQRFLTREGYQVILAKDGIDALEHLQSITPDIILADIEMPRMDGFDLTRNVRGAARTEGIPIIMITSRTAEKHRNYAKELGVNEYLGKPYNEEELLRLIRQHVGKKEAVN
jgi:chemosensory pili system protein ChpA (sensor histidine kinase/response regulator)